MVLLYDTVNPNRLRIFSGRSFSGAGISIIFVTLPDDALGLVALCVACSCASESKNPTSVESTFSPTRSSMGLKRPLQAVSTSNAERAIVKNLVLVIFLFFMEVRSER